MKSSLILLLCNNLLIFMSANVSAVTLYVDGNLGDSCIGNYSIASRDCSGSDGNAYQTVVNGIAAMSSGDTLNIRSGTYTENDIQIAFNGPETIIQAYNSEVVTIHNAYEPTTVNDGKATFDLSNACSLLIVKDLIFTGTKSATVDEDYNAIAIGQPSGTAGNLITIDNCQFSGFAHCAIKGAFRWWIKNCQFEDVGGTTANIEDWHDHHIYSTGQQTSGGEAIIENNYFGSVGGAAVHLYSDPHYHIVRNNIINGIRSTAGAYWGILLGGSNHKIYGNTIYDCYNGITVYKSNCHDNELKNNLFDGNINADMVIDYGGDSFPSNNSSLNNLFGSSTVCSRCTDQTGNGGDDYTVFDDSPNIISSANQFVTETPSNWYDFRLTKGAEAIDAGANLGASYDDALNPIDTTWPPSTIDQDDYGTGWEIGAFIYVPPTAEGFEATGVKIQ